ncbi:nucleotidyltransferase family protein [archaeon]|nr:nucleotidyltransferase family protein [archaeon]MBL7057005.1 nucleotidyltransferase family protein [Candidatus Woesearchaeota archaeon]
MNKEEQTILEITKQFINNKNIKENKLPCIDWDKLESIHSYNLIGGIVYEKLKHSSSIPKNKKLELKNNYKNVLMYSLLLKKELDRVSKIFQKNKIRFLVFKGASMVSQGYYKIGLREFMDIDILILEEDKKRAVEILKANGFGLFEQIHSKKYLEEFSTQLPFVKKVGMVDCHIDLHWQVFEKTDPYNISIEELFQHSKKNYLCPEHEVILISTFLAHHDLFRSPLKYLVDISLLLKKNQINWDFLIKTSKNWGVSSSTYFAFKKIRPLLDLQIPNKVMNQLYADSNKLDLLVKKVLVEKNILKIRRHKFGLRQALNEILLSNRKCLLLKRFFSN